MLIKVKGDFLSTSHVGKDGGGEDCWYPALANKWGNDPSPIHVMTLKHA